MKRQKLAFIIPSLKAGGAERVVSTLSNQLVTDFDIVIIVLYKCEPFYFLDSRIRIEYIQDVYIPNYSILFSIKNSTIFIKDIYKFLKNNNVNIALGFTTTANMYTVIACRLLKIPSIISERIHPEFGSISKLWFRLRKIIYPKASALVVQTKGIKDYFKSFVRESCITIIKNPLAPDLEKQRKLEPSKLNLIINIGRLEEQKNQELLIEAFSKIDNSNWQLVFIGDGNNKKKYSNIINELGLNDKVKLLGNITNVADYYNKASIFVLTSNYEGFPNVLIEAMYFGLPCISTNCPSGPSDIINDGENGFLIPVNNHQQLEKKLELLIKNSALREQFGRQAMKTSTEFEADKIAFEWKTLINNVILGL